MISVEPRVLRGLELAQAVVDAALNALQRLLALDDGLLLLAEFFFDAVDVLVFQKVGDLRQRQVERAQIPDGAEHLELARAVVAVAALGRDVFRLEQADILIVAQTAHTQVKELGNRADLKQFGLIHRAHPPTGRFSPLL